MGIIVGGPTTFKGWLAPIFNTTNVTIPAGRTIISRPLVEAFYLPSNAVIRNIAINVSTAASGLGSAQVGIYKFNNGKDFADGASLVYSRSIDVLSTGVKDLSDLTSLLKSNRLIAFSNTYSVTYVLTSHTQATAYPNVAERRKYGYLSVSGDMPSTVTVNDDLESSASTTNQITPRLLIEFI